MADYTPVIFNEGAPLDPQKLNDLQINISNLVGDVGGLKSATLDAQYTVKTDAGYFKTDDLKTGSPYTLEVPYSSSFAGVPKIIASIGSAISSGEIVTVSVASSTSKPTIQVWTNKNRGPVTVNWIAFEKI